MMLAEHIVADKAGSETGMDERFHFPMWFFPLIPALVGSQPAPQEYSHIPPLAAEGL